MLIFPGLLDKVLLLFCGGLAKLWITLGYLAGISVFSKILCQNLMFPGICRWEIELFWFSSQEFDFQLQFLPRSTFHLNFVPGSCFLKVLFQNLIFLAFSLRNSSFVWFLANNCFFVGLLARILFLIRFFVRFGYLKDLCPDTWFFIDF